MKKNKTVIKIMEEVSSYIAGSREAHLPEEVVKKTKHHILDTLAAVVSGSTLKSGQLAKKFVQSQGGVEEAQIITSPIITSAINAAFVNGIMGHADETDDNHSKSGIHPGCAVVPAALSMSERAAADGICFLKGVVAGYDIGCRMTRALGSEVLPRSTNLIGQCFGAAAAAAAVAKLKEDLVAYVLSYAAQQASGIFSWVRDPEHIEPAFVFGGMTARNGVTAAILIESGFTGVKDPFEGDYNFFEAFSPNCNPKIMAEGLGTHFEIMDTNIKKFPVGGPIQAPLEALLLLMEEHEFTASEVRTITVRVPSWGAQVVGNRETPDISLQHILAVTVLDRSLTFESAHSHERMTDPAVLGMKKQINLLADSELDVSKSLRQGVVEITTKSGAKFRKHVLYVPGMANNPMTTPEVEKKCRGLLIPVLGEVRTQKLIDKIWNLEKISNIQELRSLLS